MIGLLLAAAALVATAGLGAAALRFESAVTFAIALWVLACAEVVLAAELLSLLDAIRPLGFAVFETIALILALAVWHRVGRPRPPAVRIGRVAADPLLVVLAVAVLLGLGYELFLVFATPPNNWDSMHYHLARVAAWHARQSLGYFPTHNGIENAYPRDAELLVLWTVVFLGRDTVAALPQLLAGVAATASVFVISRRLGYGRRRSAFAALLLPTLTIVALESVTTQNDLVEAAFVAAAVAFALGRTRAEVAMAGLALGLAAGTKLTFAYALPALLAIGLLALPRRRLAEVAVAAVAGFALLGMHGYAQNLVETGRLQGNAVEVESLPPHVTAGGTASSIARTMYRLVDLSGFHPPAAVSSHVAGLAKRVFTVLHIEPNPPASTTTGTFEFTYELNAGVSEDSSALGPLGFLLLVPLSVGFLVAWALRRTDRRHAAFALALPLYMLALVLGTRWNLYVERFMITPAALTLPLAPAVFRPWPVRACAAVVGIAALALALAYDPSKPSGIDGRTPVWNLSRAEVQAIRWPELEPVLQAIQARVPARARLGIDLAPPDWEYPLWGPRLGRSLVWLPSRRPLAFAQGADWVVLGTGIHATARGWCRQRFPSVHWTLLHRC